VGYRKLLDELITFNDGSEIYCFPVDGNCLGKTFKEASKYFLEMGSILIAVQHDAAQKGKIEINPSGNLKLFDSDSLFVISRTRPS